MKRTVVRREDWNKRSCPRKRENVQTDRYTNREINKQTHGQTNTQIVRQTDEVTVIQRASKINQLKKEILLDKAKSSRKVYIKKIPGGSSSRGKTIQKHAYKHTGKYTDKHSDKHTIVQTVSLVPLTTSQEQTVSFDDTNLNNNNSVKTSGEVKQQGDLSNESRGKYSLSDWSASQSRDEIPRDKQRRLPGWLRKQLAFSKKLVYSLDRGDIQGLSSLIRHNHHQLLLSRHEVEVKWRSGEDTQTDTQTDTYTDSHTYRYTDRQRDRHTDRYNIDTQTDKQDDTQSEVDCLFDQKIEFFDKNFLID